MTRFPIRSFVLLLLSLALAGAVSASPGFWQAATQADFLRGEIEQLSIDEHGRLMLGPRLDQVHDAGVPFVWTALRTRDGSFFLGTGNDGRVIKVDAKGAGSVFYDSPELDVHALAEAPDGSLYVGTSPDGRIYKVNARGEATPFFEPEGKYIWALLVDRRGTLYAATGDQGVVYRIAPDGTGRPFFESKATHAVSLAFDSEGRLIVGTGNPGRVFRVDDEGRGFLLLDTNHQEVKALRVSAQGILYAAAQSGRAPAAAPAPEPTSEAPPPVPSVSTEITAMAVVEAPVMAQASPPPSSRGDSRGPTGAVFRIQPDGLWDQIWESREDAPYDVTFEADGALLVATGGRGRVYRLSGEPIRTTLLTRIPAQQGTTWLRGSDRTWLVTANPGMLLSLSAGHAERGTYTSDVKDAQMVATWGTLSWRATIPAGAGVEIHTRAGNTPAPDETWSEWAGPYANGDGTPVTSPNARYLQWRAVFTAKGESPVLTSLTTAYLQRNVRPRVTSITVHPPGVVFQKPFPTGEAEIAGFDAETPDRRMAQAQNQSGGAPSLGRRSYQRGLQTFLWRAEDDNGDELLFDVLYRREGETAWKVLKTGLIESILVWDTTSVPNGTYVLKVVASDQLSNPPDRALRGELESSSFEIDNTPPDVVIGPVRGQDDRFQVEVEVRDADSPIVRVEYSLDAQRWQNAFPRDGMLDSRVEHVDLVLDAAAAGRTLVVRAWDSMGNVGTGQVVVR